MVYGVFGEIASPSSLSLSFDKAEEELSACCSYKVAEGNILKKVFEAAGCGSVSDRSGCVLT